MGMRKEWDLSEGCQRRHGRLRRGEVLGLVSSPITVRKPPRESCSGSVGGSFASIPTSMLAEPPTF